MADGIRDKVAILGMGCTRFGERWESSAYNLMVEAFMDCLEDAGIEKKEIQAAYLGTHFDEVNVSKGATPLSMTLRLPFIPVTRTENFCATATEAFRAACYSVAAGVYDIVLALGVEKLKDTGYGGLPDTTSPKSSEFRVFWGPQRGRPGFSTGDRASSCSVVLS
jgi:acetyl-CoA C-acetyltransferase